MTVLCQAQAKVSEGVAPAVPKSTITAWSEGVWLKDDVTHSSSTVGVGLGMIRWTHCGAPIMWRARLVPFDIALEMIKSTASNFEQ